MTVFSDPAANALFWICALAVVLTIIFCCWGNAIEADLKRRMQSRDRSQEGAGATRKESA